LFVAVMPAGPVSSGSLDVRHTANMAWFGVLLLCHAPILHHPQHAICISFLSDPLHKQLAHRHAPNLLICCLAGLLLCSGAPRGFAFVELASIAEAGKVMLACNGKVLQGQRTALRICYAKAKDRLLGAAAVPGEADGAEAGAGPAAAAAGAAAAGAAAAGAAAARPAAAAGASGGRKAAAGGPLGWKPKEFDAQAVLDGSGSGSSSKQQEQPAASGPAAAASDAAAQQISTAQPAAAATAAPAAAAAAGPGPSTESAAAAAAAGVDAATIQALAQAGFEYQPSSGYWYDAKSGYYYDAKTQLYYHHSTSQWYKYDHATGQYNAVGAGQQQQQGQQVQQQQQQLVQQQVQPQQQGQQQPAAAADKRRRAVIGSAPQYNREGLLAAAALAKVRSCNVLLCCLLWLLSIAVR
jgi:hypothetical protein